MNPTPLCERVLAHHAVIADDGDRILAKHRADERCGAQGTASTVEVHNEPLLGAPLNALGHAEGVNDVEVGVPGIPQQGAQESLGLDNALVVSAQASKVVGPPATGRRRARKKTSVNLCSHVISYRPHSRHRLSNPTASSAA